MLRGNVEWHITESSFKYDSKALDYSNGSDGDMKLASIEIKKTMEEVLGAQKSGAQLQICYI